MKVLRNVNFLLILLFSLSCTTPEQQQPTIERVDVDTFEAKLNTLNNAFLIDVRTPSEYKSGHIDGAKNIDFNQADNMKIAFEKLDHNQPMLIYCAAGGRSNKTRVLMAEMGFTQVYELSSGMGGWEAAGKPISLK
jgi:rhodanese-related sulfurtransferase|tara:strand:+ start:5024 stop:5431 length:408 start_codon:yes stop_codon:yes gene_type:complete